MKAIVNVDQNWAIGKNNDLLFRNKTDLKFFKEITMSKSIIMGRKTYDSLPSSQFNYVSSNGSGYAYEKLPGRRKHILTRQKDLTSKASNIFFYNTVESIIEKVKNSDDEFIVIGGGQIYKEFAPYIDELYITHTKKIAENPTTYFPVELRPNYEWTCIETLYEDEEIAIKHYVKE